MENKEGETGSGCGSRKGCCGCKAVAALVLLLIGGIGGYLCGRHCGKGRGMCPMPHETTEVNIKK